MAKYDESFKLAVVQEYLSEAPGFRALAHKYLIDQATIRRWVDNYRQHGHAGLSKKLSHNSAQFKLSVLQQMWREELSYRQIVTLFDCGRRGRGTPVS